MQIERPAFYYSNEPHKFKPSNFSFSKFNRSGFSDLVGIRQNFMTENPWARQLVDSQAQRALDTEINGQTLNLGPDFLQTRVRVGVEARGGLPDARDAQGNYIIPSRIEYREDTIGNLLRNTTGRLAIMETYLRDIAHVFAPPAPAPGVVVAPGAFVGALGAAVAAAVAAAIGPGAPGPGAPATSSTATSSTATSSTSSTGASSTGATSSTSSTGASSTGAASVTLVFNIMSFHTQIIDMTAIQPSDVNYDIVINTNFQTLSDGGNFDSVGLPPRLTAIKNPVGDSSKTPVVDDDEKLYGTDHPIGDDRNIYTGIPGDLKSGEQAYAIIAHAGQKNNINLYNATAEMPGTVTSAAPFLQYTSSKFSLIGASTFTRMWLDGAYYVPALRTMFDNYTDARAAVDHYKTIFRNAKITTHFPVIATISSTMATTAAFYGKNVHLTNKDPDRIDKLIKELEVSFTDQTGIDEFNAKYSTEIGVEIDKADPMLSFYKGGIIKISIKDFYGLINGSGGIRWNSEYRFAAETDSDLADNIGVMTGAMTALPSGVVKISAKDPDYKTKLDDIKSKLDAVNVSVYNARYATQLKALKVKGKILENDYVVISVTASSGNLQRRKFAEMVSAAKRDIFWSSEYRLYSLDQMLLKDAMDKFA